jgi:hypothetical protein
MRVSYCLEMTMLIAAALSIFGCASKGDDPLEGKWEVIAVRGTQPGVFLHEIWEFRNNRYSVEGLGLHGRYELNVDSADNTIMLYSDLKTDVTIAGIYKITRDGKELTMKLGNAENSMPNSQGILLRICIGMMCMCVGGSETQLVRR